MLMKFPTKFREAHGTGVPACNLICKNKPKYCVSEDFRSGGLIQNVFIKNA